MLHIVNEIEKQKTLLKKEYKPCKLCRDRLIYSNSDELCECKKELYRLSKLIDCGLPRDLIDPNISENSIYNKEISKYNKNITQFLEKGLGLLIYGNISTGKTTALAKYFIDAVLSSKDINGIFIMFTELIDIIRMKRLSNDVYNELNKLLNKNIVFIDNINDDIDNKSAFEFLTILNQIFIRQGSALLMTCDFSTNIEMLKFPNSLKEFLFCTKKIKPLSIVSSKQTKHWEGRIFNQKNNSKLSNFVESF